MKELNVRQKMNSREEQDDDHVPSELVLTEREIKILQKAIDLAVHHHNSGNLNKAEIVYNRILEVHPNQPIALNCLGLIAYQRGQCEIAVELIAKALTVKADYPEALNNLGNSLVGLGAFEDGLDKYRKAVSLDSAYAEAHRNLSKAKVFSDPSDTDLRAMDSVYHSPGITNEQRMNLAFGLGKAYEDLSKFEKSFEYYQVGNTIRYSGFNYIPWNVKQTFEDLKSVFTKELFTRRQGTGVLGATPVFIIGMPRSGSTLVEQILASHANIFGAGEVFDLETVIEQYFDSKGEFGFVKTIYQTNFEVYREAGEKYLFYLRKYADDQELITDKMLGNYLRVGMIKLMFPDAKVIHCYRNPMDTCLSIYKNYFQSNGYPYAYDLEQLGAQYKRYQDLMAHWRGVLPGFIYEIKYEDLIYDQKRETINLLEFCDMTWDDACLRFYNTDRSVSTASATQVRKPIYSDSVNRWKKYEKQLAPLIKALK